MIRERRGKISCIVLSVRLGGSLYAVSMAPWIYTSSVQWGGLQINTDQNQNIDISMRQWCILCNPVNSVLCRSPTLCSTILNGIQSHNSSNRCNAGNLHGGRFLLP